MILTVLTSDGGMFILDVEPTDSIENIKAKIQDQISVNPAQQKLVYNSVEMIDGLTLSDYFTTNNATINLIIIQTKPNWTFPYINNYSTVITSNTSIGNGEKIFIGGIENNQNYFKRLHQTPGQYFITVEEDKELILEENKIDLNQTIDGPESIALSVNVGPNNWTVLANKITTAGTYVIGTNSDNTSGSLKPLCDSINAFDDTNGIYLGQISSNEIILKNHYNTINTDYCLTTDTNS